MLRLGKRRTSLIIAKIRDTTVLFLSPLKLSWDEGFDWVCLGGRFWMDRIWRPPFFLCVFGWWAGWDMMAWKGIFPLDATGRAR